MGTITKASYERLAAECAEWHKWCRELEAENAALRHDLKKSMANHVADINGSQSDRGRER